MQLVSAFIYKNKLHHNEIELAVAKLNVLTVLHNTLHYLRLSH